VRWRADVGKWEVRWRENGRHHSKCFTRKADGALFEAKVVYARERGEVLELDRGKESLAEFMETWWARYAIPELADKTRVDYGRAWEKHVRKPLGGYRVRDLTPVVVDEYRAKLLAAGVGEATVGKVLTLLSGMFRCAVTWGRIDRNPMQEIRIPQPKRTRLVRPLSPERIEAMRQPMLREGRLLDATLISVLAYAGLRPQEARALQWGDVGLRMLKIERAAAGTSVKSTKTGKLRTVGLVPPLGNDLRAWRQASGSPDDTALVFATNGGTLWTDDDWRNWRKRVYGPAVSAIGLAGSRPYDLRHSFASLLIQAGASVVEVARQMGNAPSVTLDTYGHVLEDRDPSVNVTPAEAIEGARSEFGVREEYARASGDVAVDPPEPASTNEALYQTRTDDPLLTMEVLYQLS
jgi:integrase